MGPRSVFWTLATIISLALAALLGELRWRRRRAGVTDRANAARVRAEEFKRIADMRWMDFRDQQQRLYLVLVIGGGMFAIVAANRPTEPDLATRITYLAAVTSLLIALLCGVCALLYKNVARAFIRFFGRSRSSTWATDFLKKYKRADEVALLEAIAEDWARTVDDTHLPHVMSRRRTWILYALAFTVFGGFSYATTLMFNALHV
jgi:hypothetical protein